MAITKQRRSWYHWLGWSGWKAPRWMSDWMPEWLKLALKVGWRLFLLGMLVFILLAIFYYFLAKQYDLDEVEEMTHQNMVLDETDANFATLGGERRVLLERDEIPENMIVALLAREDADFYEHSGIHLKGLARATLRNIKDMSFTQGASTISMQLVKNTYDIRAKSLHRKFLEIAITLRLEDEYDKDEILTHYLNRIYFGAGCHGLEEASQTYFGVKAIDMNLGQCALLAGIIRGPHIFSPFNDLEAAIEQRDQVLARMVTIEKITQAEADEAMKMPLNIVPAGKRQKSSSYAMNGIERHAKEILDDEQISDGGLRVKSTINEELQKDVDAAVSDILSTAKNSNDGKPLQAAVVILDTQTGAIRALTGGRNYQKHPFNRALDSKLELGHAFYPFLYVATLERNRVPLVGKPLVTGNQLGYSDLLGFCQRFGIDEDPSKLAEDLYRGGVSASPLELASAFSIFKNDGAIYDSFFISSIKKSSGDVLFDRAPTSKPVVDKANAKACLELMKKDGEVFAYTAKAYHNAWVVAVSEKKTVVIWLGYDKPAAINDVETLKAAFLKKATKWAE